MKNSNVHESPIACNTLHITYAEFGVKWRVPKRLLECSMQNLHKEVSSSPDNGCLLGARHVDKNDVIINDKMLCSLASP